MLALLLVLVPLQEDPARLRGLLRERLDADRGSAVAAGVVDARGTVTAAEGSLRKGGPAGIDAGTIFEIGSITKTFTALLLSDMALRGELALEDPVARLLPAGTRVPSRGETPLTLLHLVQHRSGLPRMPTNFSPADPANPYADYDAARLYEFLAGHVLARSPGAAYEYSNVGSGLLGHALALRGGKPYEDLLAERVLKPLGLESTSIAIPAERRARLAAPHDTMMREVKNWDLGVLAGAGALRSNVPDLLRYLSLQLGLMESPLAKAATATQGRRVPAGAGGIEIALGWHVLAGKERTIFMHSGGTGGYRAFAGFDLRARRGVVVLGNSEHSVDDLGLHLLDPKHPLPKPFRPVEVDPAVLDRHLGSYQLAPGFLLKITREGGRLFGQATGQPRFPLLAVSPSEFRYEEAKIVIVFPETPGRLKYSQGGPAVDVLRVGE